MNITNGNNLEYGQTQHSSSHSNFLETFYLFLALCFLVFVGIVIYIDDRCGCVFKREPQPQP